MSVVADRRQLNLVLIEDDDIDAEMVARALAREGVFTAVHRARDGVEAFDILLGDDGRPPLERPYLILLDIRMPRMDGLQFLARLRETPGVADSVVFVLTTSDDDRDIVAAYDRCVAGYLLKDQGSGDLVDVARMLDLYWRHVEFPPGARN